MTEPKCTTDRSAVVCSSAFFTLLGTVGLMAVAVLYVELGTGLLERMGISVGEVLMKEGIRLEDAGAKVDALARYRLALDARFQGPQNRAYTLERVGNLFRTEGNYEAALPYLRQATSSLHSTVGAHLNLADTLLRLERHTEAEVAIRRCFELVEEEGDSEVVTTATYYAGRLALARGDIAATEARFLEAYALQPGSEAALALGRLYYDRGNREQALEFIEAYLIAGATGTRADTAYAIRQNILNARPTPSSNEPE